MRLTLNGIKRRGAERSLAKIAGKSVNIWSAQWSAWWRADSSGYTKLRADAGIYTFEDAYARTRHCGPEKRIEYFTLGIPTKRQRLCLEIVASEPLRMDQEDERLAPFCDDKPSRHDTDTFNQCIDAGWLRAWHDSLADEGSVEITPAGRAALQAGEAKG